MDSLRQRKNIDSKQKDDCQNEVEVQDYRWVQQLILKSCGVFLAFLVLAFLYVEFCVPCPIEPEAYKFDPTPKFEGPLEPNNELKKIKKLNEGDFKGPESLAVYEGKIYTGVSDGRIIEIDIATNNFRTVTETLGKPPCGGHANEEHCGRPLGLRVKNGFIYTVDAYLGLFKINIATGEKHNLYDASQPLPDGYQALFLNDIEVGHDGKIYLTDSSYQFRRDNHPYVGFEGSAKGRLIVYDEKTNQTTILLRNLYAANGIQLTPGGDSLLISETTRSRILRYYINGLRAGETENFSDNLPGLPDNMRPSSRGGYWVALSVTRHPDLWSSWDLTSPHPWIRRLMAKTLSKSGFLRTLPKYGLVLELDSEGKIIRSLHDQDGSTLPSTSEILEHQGRLYLGSFQLPFLGRYTLPSHQALVF